MTDSKNFSHTNAEFRHLVEQNDFDDAQEIRWGESDYRDNKTPMDFTCLTHGPQTVIPQELLGKRGLKRSCICGRCGRSRNPGRPKGGVLHFGEAQEKSRKQKLELLCDESNFRGSWAKDLRGKQARVKYRFRCLEASCLKPFESDYRAWCGSRGCPRCGKEVNTSINQGRSRQAGKRFIQQAKEKYGALYDYNKVEYSSSSTAVTIGCPQHGSFQKTPNKHLAGQGCPKHNRYGSAHVYHSEQAMIYLVIIERSGFAKTIMWGITTKSSVYKRHEQDGCWITAIIGQWRTDGPTAQRAENSLKRFSEFAPLESPLDHKGTSEMALYSSQRADEIKTLIESAV